MDGGVGEVLLDELKEINYIGPVQMHYLGLHLMFDCQSETLCTITIIFLAFETKHAFMSIST